MNKTMNRTRQFFSVMAISAIVLLASCGGGKSDCVNTDPTRDPNLPRCGGSGTTPTPTPTPPNDPKATTVQLLLSSPQLNSDGASTITVTVIAQDVNNQATPNRQVLLAINDPSKTAFISNFSQPVSPTSGNTHPTNANGQLTASINVGGDRSNRTITLSATVDTASATSSVNVTGTTLAISGSNALVFGASTQLSLVVSDSAGRPVNNAPVTVTSQNGNTIALVNPQTDIKGQILATVTGSKAGTDSISASASGASASYAITVSSNNFSFTSPAPGTSVQINTPLNLVLHWDSNGAPVAGSVVNFSTTRGTITPSQATTDASGNINGLTVTSTIPGPATITATSQASGGPSASLNVQYSSTNTPDKIALQTDRSIVSVNPPGTNANTATLSAVVRDKDNFPVQGATVNFHIDQDQTGGALTSATATTDSTGTAKSQYVPTSTPSSTNGVVISAVVANSTVTQSSLSLTVGGQKLFVRIGTDNKVGSSPAPDPNYAKTYSAFVTDAAGNAVPNVTVQFLLRPRQEITPDPIKYLTDATYVSQLLARDVAPPAGIPLSTDYSYYKGFYVWNGVVWAPVVKARCFNEDANFDGIQEPGEDHNANGALEPGNIFSITPSAVTNSSGYAVTTITYPKDRANWVAVTLKATAQAFGTEATDAATFQLPGAADDFNKQDTAPPGQPSPYGISTVCTDTK
jgi:Bacterial Ig-like domain (group 1)